MEESTCSGTVNLGDGISGAGIVNILKGIGYMTINSLTITEPAPIPEPGTLLLVAVGMFGLAFCRRRSYGTRLDRCISPGKSPVRETR
jgi:PEP-CTERM motif